MTRSIPAILAALLLAALPAQAQKAGPNGGVVIVAEGHPIEFVSTDKEIVFYINDEADRPLSTASASGRASIQDAGKTLVVTLAAAAPNKLVGKLATPLSTGAKVVLSIRIHGHSHQARFEKT